MLIALAVSWPSLRSRCVDPVFKSMRTTFVFLGVAWLWGVLFKGGSAYQTLFQLHPFVNGLVTTYMLMATCRTVAHFETLGKVIVFACIYRVIILFIFYFEVAVHQPKELNVLTSHSDSVLFCAGMLILIVYAVERRTALAALSAVLGSIATAMAIQLNNRRLAWAGVFIGLAFLYVTMPKDRVKKRIRTTLIVLSPFLIAYVAAGWGHPTGFFKPVGSISTLFGQNQDVSSIMRDIENYNLRVTLKTNPFLGQGWGTKYIEEVVAYDISGAFPQYRYMPHNSYLGLLAFTGWIGFAGITQLLAVASFFLARAHGFARRPVARTAALSSLTGLVMYLLYAWGDVGLQVQPASTLLACCLAVAGRLPVLVGAYPFATPPAKLAGAPIGPGHSSTPHRPDRAGV
jgi:hypothetical protein